MMGSTVPLLLRIEAHDASNRPINVHTPSQTSRTLREGASVIPGLRADGAGRGGDSAPQGRSEVAMDLITSSTRPFTHAGRSTCSLVRDRFNNGCGRLLPCEPMTRVRNNVIALPATRRMISAICLPKEWSPSNANTGIVNSSFPASNLLSVRPV